MTHGPLPVPGSSATDADPEAPGSQPPGEVRELFVVLGKALRAYQLYDENNPVYQRFVSSLAEAFRRVWSELDRLTVHVTEDALLLGSAEVYRAESRSDSLAFLFFKDGIREVSFLEGIEEEELTRFLSVLQRARKARQEGDDLLTILWDEDLQFFRYKYVDLLAEGVEMPVPGDGGSADALQSVLAGELEDAGPEEGVPETSRSVNREDFNPTLYSLDPREMETLQREIRLEMSRDLREGVMNALFDRLEEPGNPGRQSEIIGVFRQLLPNLLSRGALEPASRVLGELRAMEARDGVLDVERRRAVEGILDEISTPAAVEELVRGLEDGSLRPPPDRLGRFLRFLRPGALGPLLRAAETTEIKEVRPVLREAVVGIARGNEPALLHLLEDEDAVVVAGAARLAGRMQITEAGPFLAHLLRHPSSRVRLAAVEAAADMRASTVAGALREVLEDADREVRIAAARALGKLRYGPAARDLRDLIQSREVKASDLTEKIAFFECYGLIAGDDAVPVLDRMLNGRSLFRLREAPEIRACAALALGKIGTAAARAALEGASAEEDPVVRSAVNRALRAEEA